MYKASTRDETHNSKRESINKTQELLTDILKQQRKAKSHSKSIHAWETCFISRGFTKQVFSCFSLYFLKIPCTTRSNGRQWQ